MDIEQLALEAKLAEQEILRQSLEVKDRRIGSSRSALDPEDMLNRAGERPVQYRSAAQPCCYAGCPAPVGPKL